MNGNVVIVRVVGKLPDTGINAKISIRLSSIAFEKKDKYFNLILVVCVRWKESYGDNRTNAIGLIANLFNINAESIFKIYDECREEADQYISIMPNMREISNFLNKSQS